MALEKLRRFAYAVIALWFVAFGLFIGVFISALSSLPEAAALMGIGLLVVSPVGFWLVWFLLGKLAWLEQTS